MIIENQEDQLEVPEIVEEVDEEGNDKTDWKSIALKNQGIAKRFKTKLEKRVEKPVEKPAEEKPAEQKVQTEKKEFDYAELSYLETKGYSDEKEQELVWNAIKETGKSLKEVLNNKYLQAEIKDMRDAKASADAIPPGSKRSAQSGKDKVDYWLAKGQLPPADQPELRREYVNAKLKAETTGSPFTDRPVVM